MESFLKMAPEKLYKRAAVATMTDILSFVDTGKHIDEAKKCIEKGESAGTVLTKMKSFASIKPASLQPTLIL
jgi:hypothetical protein